ncbi:MAG: M20/M25/M40 family metallo-hydrolase [Planctomycetes bacterium]|nr:M20/M25/M40 family metallo-hydrolase [Planctomycetota bacterium]
MKTTTPQAPASSKRPAATFGGSLKGTAKTIDKTRAEAFVERAWEQDILPTITEYIRIPNKSPHFDPKWQENGHMKKAADLIEAWCKKRKLPGLKVERVQLPNRTPLLFMELPGPSGSSNQGDDTVVLYGHLDKQPEMVGWRQGLGPWQPVREGDRLYGRGGADDGYAAFASLTALEILAEQGIPHARCVILIEGCEESGSYDLPFYIDHLEKRIGSPSLVVCLDSGCGDYERMWSTTSLRGLVGGDLVVEILREGVHSGDAGGVVPDSFRIARAVLSRLEDQASGEIVPKAFHAKIPPERVEGAKACAKILGKKGYARFPWVEGAKPQGTDPAEILLNRTWRPALAVTGAEGLPAIKDAGNVLRPRTALKLALRIPPTVDGDKAAAALKQILEKNPPHGAKVAFQNGGGTSGWNAPKLERWLERAVDDASKTFFGKPAASMGEGGTIPFMGMLGRKFPKAQFVITGVLGPESNAHGPNEFLHVPTAKKLTGAVAAIVADHFTRA